MASCEHCERLRLAALDTSRICHNLLRVLEAAHDDTELTSGIQQHLAKALLERDEAVRVLKDHERVHARTSGG